MLILFLITLCSFNFQKQWAIFCTYRRLNLHSYASFFYSCIPMWGTSRSHLSTTVWDLKRPPVKLFLFHIILTTMTLEVVTLDISDTKHCPLQHTVSPMTVLWLTPWQAITLCMESHMPFCCWLNITLAHKANKSFNFSWYLKSWKASMFTRMPANNGTIMPPE